MAKTGVTHDEIKKILSFCDQRMKTIFLFLASTGIRVGVLNTIRIGDLERVNDVYKVTVYPGDREEYYTFCTPENAKELMFIQIFEKDMIRKSLIILIL
jgi:integrase